MISIPCTRVPCTARVVVQDPDDAPARLDAVDRVDQLERLAREAARADDQQRLRRHALTAAIWVSRHAITWSCCSSVSPAKSGSISELSDAVSVQGSDAAVPA